MPYSNKQMLRDANGDLIPQYWDVVEQEFKPLTGRDGANDVRLTGSIVEIASVDNFSFSSFRGFISNTISDSSSQIAPLNDFKEYAFVIENISEDERSIRVEFNCLYRGTRYQVGESFPVEAGAVAFITPKTHEELRDIIPNLYLGIGLREGIKTVNVRVFGRV